MSESNTPVSEKDYAQTPRWFINSLESLMGKRFQLDVCAERKTAKCVRYYNLDYNREDALELPWLDFNWCNPPFTNIESFIDKCVIEAQSGNTSCVIMPNTPETAYVRKIKQVADTIIEMPFRLKFLRPDGSAFISDSGKENSPKFSCLVGLVTPIGLIAPTRFMYHDFRIGFK